jgi:hypothetical protein
MKIDFGETTGEYLERILQWHTSFAWIPRRISAHDYRWLEYVQRRGNKDFWEGINWEYRAITKPPTGFI